MACSSSQGLKQISSKRALLDQCEKPVSRLSLAFPLLSPLVAASLVKSLQPSPGQGGSWSPARQLGPDRAERRGTACAGWTSHLVQWLR